MQGLIIAVAQISATKGNVEKNIATHIKAIEKASSLGVSYIVFPELSLTGYEPELAAELAFTDDDQRLSPLIDCARLHNVIVGAGAPLRNKQLSEALPHIGQLTIFPAGAVESYAKIHLHPGEEKFFSPGRRHYTFDINDTRIASAICADTNHAIHAKTCCDLGARLYIAGVWITESGYSADALALSGYARDLNMLVAIANYSQMPDGRSTAGKSAIWGESGLLASADDSQNALVIAEEEPDGWDGRVVAI